MAARELEAAQKALRQSDYDEDSSSDDDEEMIILSTGSISASPVRKVLVNPTAELVSFDPYSPSAQRNEGALLDDISVHTVETVEEHPCHIPTVRTSMVPGGAGYLEMEEAPPRYSESSEPITTSSGLMLTHRRHSPTSYRTNLERSRDVTASVANPITSGTRTIITQPNGMQTVFDKSDPLTRDSGNPFHSKQRQFFEVENGFLAWKASADEDLHGNDKRRHSMPILQARRFLSYVRIWMVLSAAFLVLATGVLFHAWGHDPAESVAVKERSDTKAAGSASLSSAAANSGNGAAQQYVVGGTSFNTGGATQIILVPMQDISDAAKRQQIVTQQQQIMRYQVQPPRHQIPAQQHHQHGIRRALKELRQEFDEWTVHHGKKYHSDDEKEHRFRIWTENHQR